MGRQKCPVWDTGRQRDLSKVTQQTGWGRDSSVDLLPQIHLSPYSGVKWDGIFKKLLAKLFPENDIRSTLERGSDIYFPWINRTKDTGVEVDMMPSLKRDKHLPIIKGLWCAKYRGRHFTNGFSCYPGNISEKRISMRYPSHLCFLLYSVQLSFVHEGQLLIKAHSHFVSVR